MSPLSRGALRSNVEAHIFDLRFRRPKGRRLSLILDGVIVVEERLRELARLHSQRAA